MQYIPAPWRERYVKNALKTKGCVLCGALKRGADKEAYILYRGTHHFIILNTFPYTPGHLMIAPLRHTADFARTSPAAASELAGLLKLAVRVLGAHYHPQGFNAGMNLGRSAGAGVADHYHLHVIPRWTGDSNFMPLVGRTRVLTEDLDTTYERLFPLFEKERKRAARRTRKEEDPSQSR
jgi:ATP adenylyltransferase